MKRYHEFAKIAQNQINEALKQEETMDLIASMLAECIKKELA